MKPINRCWTCGWFDKWDNLILKHYEGQKYRQYPEWQPEWDEEDFDYYEHKDECEKFTIPNPKRRARSRCPKCNHGKPEGHGGRTCIAGVVTYDYEGIRDDSWCGCTYDGRLKT